VLDSSTLVFKLKCKGATWEPNNKWKINEMVLKITGCEDAETIQEPQVKIVRKPWDPKDAGNLLTNRHTSNFK